jgi:hypothetical protein
VRVQGFGGLKLTKTQHFPVTTKRCASRGYLEFYARA